jgi:hypothetical protein
MLVLLFSFLLQFDANANFDALKYSGDREFTVHAVHCGDSYELLDYKELFDVDPNYQFMLRGTSVVDILNSYFERISKFDTARGSLYKSWYESLSEETKFIENMNFGQSKDYLNFVQWDGCKIEIFAKAINPANFKKSLFIDSGIWKKLSSRDKAGFYINYLLNLEHVIYNGAEHTEFSRYTNAVLASSQFDALKRIDLIHLYRLLKIEEIFYKNVWYTLGNNSVDRVNPFEVDSDGNVLRGTFGDGGYWLFRSLNFQSRFIFENEKEIDLTLTGNKINPWRDNNYFYIRKIKAKKSSGCLGRFDLRTLKNLSVKVSLINGKAYLDSVFGPIIYQGREVDRIEKVNGVWTLIIDNVTTTTSTDDTEIGLCI